MSTILKALQRVEEERPSGAGSVPRRAVRGDFVAEGARGLMRKRRRAGPRPVLWSSVGAAVLMAGLVWWRLPDREPELVEASEARSEGNARAESSGRPGQRAERSAPSPAPAAERLARPAPPPAASREAEPAPAAIAQPEAPPPVAAAAPEPELPTAPALPPEVAERLPPLGVTLDAASPEVVAKAPAEPAPVAAAPEPPPVAVEPPAPAPPAAGPKPTVAKVAPQRPPPAPVAKPVPPPPSAPAVLVERTSWHPSVERRVAWVSVEGLAGARELHEGDAVGALVVKEIRPSSVIFRHGADTIQRRVGERP